MKRNRRGEIDLGFWEILILLCICCNFITACITDIYSEKNEIKRLRLEAFKWEKLYDTLKWEVEHQKKLEEVIKTKDEQIEIMEGYQEETPINGF